MNADFDRYRRHTGMAVHGIAACTALMLASSALAQSVVPSGSPSTSSSASTSTGTSPGPASAAPTGARPPKSQPLPAEALPGGRPGPQGVPQAIHWTENWSAIPPADAPLIEKIRHIPIGSGTTYLSLGGEARVYYTDWTHATLGLNRNDGNDPVQLRLRLFGDLHVGSNIRAFVELGDTREFGERVVIAANENKLDIQQAFVDLTLPLGDAGQITLRPGRFEMPLGNGKLVSLREAVAQRFSYQGIRGTYILPGKISIDAFAVRPVNLKPGMFDDGPNHAATFTGVYVSAPNRIAGFGTDVYWYAMNRDRGVLTQGAGRDDRNSWGGRIWQRTPTWDIDLEATYQSGTFTTESIEAFAVLFEGGYTFAETPLAPRLGLRANVFSGDTNLKDGKAGTFIAPSPRLPLISEATFFNFSNLMDLYPSVTFKPHKDILLMVGPDFLWRNSRADGVYIGSAGTSFAPYASGRRIGTDLNLEASWQATKRIQFRLFETYFAASDSFAAHGGRSSNYIGLQTDLRL